MPPRPEDDRARALAGIARLIDHTLLRCDATVAAIDALCSEATRHRFAAVCVNPVWVLRAAQRLAGSGVTVAAVAGFPLGASRTEVKALETRHALRDGAREIDMVMNLGALKDRDLELVRHDIAEVSAACHHFGALSKVIIEAALLTDEEKVLACQLAVEAHADYVKTSTGFGPGGATVADVALLRANLPAAIGVKAAGGIRTLEQVLALVAAGANRIGTSAGVRIVTGAA